MDAVGRQRTRWLVTLSLVIFGLALRSYHYLREPSLWHDEAALVLNVIEKDYRELLGPLLCAEAAPPLFLWIERTVCLALGDDLQALRLFPLMASCMALLLVAWSARRTLPPAAVPWAVLLFAVSDQLLWHACEAKPYSVDVLCAAGVIALFVATERWPLLGRLLLFSALAPVVIWLSYPGCFLCGGLLVALLPRVWAERRTWAWYALLTLVIGASFMLLVLGPARAQRCGMMEQCWLRQFPDYHRPWTVLPWVLFSTLDVLRYCFMPNGQMLVGISIVGGVSLWRRGQRELVGMLALPTGLALLAALVHAYPYGGVRVIVYSAPAAALLVGAGVPMILAWLATWGRRLGPLACFTLVAVLLVPAGRSVYHVAKPWKRADCAGAADYVLTHRQADELVSANHWEYEYYFRELGPMYQPLATLSGPTPRMWLVLTADTNEDRQKMLDALTARAWQPIEQHEFTRTMVMLVQRNDQEPMPNVQRMPKAQARMSRKPG